MTKWNILEDAAALHQDALLWDNTLPWPNLDPPREGLPRMVANGVDAVSLTLANDLDGVTDTVQRIARERAYFLSHPDKYVLVETVDDILAARSAGKLAVIFHFQGSNPVANDLNMVELYYRLGIRHMLMAYNLRNAVGDGCKEFSGGAGLSRFGVQLVEEMNRVGMWVDCAHTGYRTSMDVLEVSKDPVIFSHTAADAVYHHSRNIRDDQIKGCAATGGIIGINGCGVFLADNEGSAETMFRHIDYIAQLVGARHVGISLHFVYDTGTWGDYKTAWNVGMEGDPDQGIPWSEINQAEPEELPRLTEVMLQHGYEDGDIRRILGDNWLHLARQVWK
jgi:membrane dipeptidase